jgi:alanine dehydrogenase
MDIGVPKESRSFEFRVGLTPSSVRILTEMGHRVYIEQDAGSMAGYTNLLYEQAGAIIVYDKEEIFARPDLLIKFSRPTFEEISLMKDKQIIMGFFHFQASKRDKLDLLMKKQITVIAYEFLHEGNEYEIMKPISTLAGKLIPTIAGQLLTNLHGGAGIVLSGAPGIPPAEVVIIGTGNAGTTIARQFINLGAQVTVLDNNIHSLEKISELTGSKVVSMLSSPNNLAKVMTYADIVVTCAQNAGDLAPIIITDDLVKSMKERSVLIDLAIDSGGNSSTSRPTNHGSPTYVKYNVLHYCVPNISSIVARSASYALNNSIMPYLTKLLKINGTTFLEKAKIDPFWRTGIVLLEGEVVHESLKTRLRQSVPSSSQ